MGAESPDITLQRNRAMFGTFSWQGQAPQYTMVGTPEEIVYRRFIETASGVQGVPKGPVIIDTLLYYDTYGALAGILNYYPLGAKERDGTPLEQPGNINLTLRPDDYGKASRELLLTEAKRRWGKGEETPWPAELIKTLNATQLIDGNRRISRLNR